MFLLFVVQRLKSRPEGAVRRVSACADTVSTQVDIQPKALWPRIHSLA